MIWVERQWPDIQRFSDYLVQQLQSLKCSDKLENGSEFEGKKRTRSRSVSRGNSDDAMSFRGDDSPLTLFPGNDSQEDTFRVSVLPEDPQDKDEKPPKKISKSNPTTPRRITPREVPKPIQDYLDVLIERIQGMSNAETSLTGKMPKLR